MQSYNVGVFHPALDVLAVALKTTNIEETDPVKICENEVIHKFVFDELEKQANKDGLFGFEKVKKIKLSPKPLSAFGIYTSTLKLQRTVARKVFEEDVKKMYASE